MSLSQTTPTEVNCHRKLKEMSQFCNILRLYLKHQKGEMQSEQENNETITFVGVDGMVLLVPINAHRTTDRKH